MGSGNMQRSYLLLATKGIQVNISVIFIVIVRKIFVEVEVYYSEFFRPSEYIVSEYSDGLRQSDWEGKA